MYTINIYIYIVYLLNLKKGNLGELDEFGRQKLERDLHELQRLIDIHFEERKDEENEFSGKKYYNILI